MREIDKLQIVKSLCECIPAYRIALTFSIAHIFFFVGQQFPADVFLKELAHRIFFPIVFGCHYHFFSL